MQSDNKDQKKRIIIGDVHCNRGWEKLVKAHPDADEIIFVGDYLDPYSRFDKYDEDCVEGVKNFIKIVDFKRANPEKVTLLIGNHDFHYLSGAKESCSRYDDYFWNQCNPLFDELYKNGEIQVVKQFCNVLVSHAGVSPAWFEAHIVEKMSEFSIEEIAVKVNELFISKIEAFRFFKMDFDGYGDHPMQSPMWIRPTSLKFEMSKLEYPKLITQVVGHTSVKKIVDLGFRHSIWMVDNQKYEYKELVFKGKNPRI